MKKIILALSAIALVVSCSQSRKWTDKERDEVRKVVRDRHDRSAIRHMEAKNYTNLEECVVTTIEETYPDYNRFDKLTGKTDTVDAVIVDCLGFTIGPNYENLPLLFPYDQLQQAGILPAGLSNDQVKSFYGCLTSKIKELYRTPDLFTIALFDEPGVPTEVADAMQQCASMVVSPADQAKADACQIVKPAFALTADDIKTEVLSVEKAAEKLVDLIGADVIVSVGRGISKDVNKGIELAEQLAAALGGGVVDPLPEDAPFFVKDYYDYYKTKRGYHKRSLNSNDGWNVTGTMSFMNMPILKYTNEIRNAVLIIHGEKAHSCYMSKDAYKNMTENSKYTDNKELMIIPNAVHTDLYDRKDIIPFDKIEEFFKTYLK